MSYQVLARKWRPNRFAELVGQEHVVTAISNALDNDRLHHAYLFTGTRGVGKTTIARIFSKSLNCEEGLGSTPCGKCGTCLEIENGNFIDLLEIDAASRTKVEDTRELLDNVQYKPSRGRYKVYLIDEVHMLSKHSFNALLKTLEEPPPHVKFLLATTDPQKLPVTILSRCLQFNLKALSRGQIAQQLEYILGQETIQFEKDALNQLARAAQGSMRDALSLTDQAIAQGNGFVSLQIVTDMLGLMDKNQVLKLVHGVIKKDSAEVMQQVEIMATQAPDFSQILAEIMSLLHQVALTQFVPDACKLETITARAIYQLAKAVPAEQVQLLYQIALTGKKDLPHAADPRTGLEMTLLRMLAFCPADVKLDPVEISQQTPEAQDIPAPSDVSAGLAASAQPLADASIPLSPAINESALAAPAASANSQVIAQQALIAPSPVSQNSVPDQVLVQEQAVAQTPVQEQNAADDQQTEQAIEQNLFEQQQSIIEQAQDMGHHAPDYNELQPVDDYADSNNVDTADSAAELSPVPDAPAAAVTSTHDLIALRNRLKQNQVRQEESAEQVKKSETTELPNLASIREQNQAEPLQGQIQNQALAHGQEKTQEQNQENKPTAPALADFGSSNSPVDSSFTNDDGTAFQQAASDNFASTHGKTASDEPYHSEVAPAQQPEMAEPLSTAEIPPWALEAAASNTAELSPQPDIEAEVFDPNAHLDIDNVGEVNLDVPAFLPNKQKVQKSTQLDEWSQLIEDMQVNALTKQLALHSAFSRNGNVVTLTLLEGKEHLNSPSAQSLLQQALSRGLNSDIQLEINMGQPINTPYAIQIKINQVRQEYAHQVVATDPGIQLLKQRFAAKVDEQSVQAR